MPSETPHQKKFCPTETHSKPLRDIYQSAAYNTMNISIDTYERELIIEALEYRIENDEELIRDYSTKEELTYLLEKIAEDF